MRKVLTSCIQSQYTYDRQTDRQTDRVCLFVLFKTIFILSKRAYCVHGFSVGVTRPFLLEKSFFKEDTMKRQNNKRFEANALLLILLLTLSACSCD